MRHRPGFGNCNDITAADGPGQSYGSWRASVCCGNAPESGIAQQVGTEATKRRIRHHRHAVPLAPWQQVAFDAAATEVVIDLIGRAAIALWNAEQILHLRDCEVGHAQARILPAARRRSNPATTSGNSTFGVGACSK